MGTAAGPELEMNRDWLRVHFNDGTSPRFADFHYFWLRHNCDIDRHPQTKERVLCPSRVDLNIRPRAVTLSADGKHVLVTWDDGATRRKSKYAVDWLRTHAYAPEREAVAPPSNDVEKVTLRADAYGSATSLRDASLERLNADGLAVVRGFDPDTEKLIDLYEDSGLSVRGTHFGRIEDLRTDNTTNQNTDQLGYTDAPVELHTDQPFLDDPPEFQLLQCMRPAESGGENYLADARQAAEYLKSRDPHGYELLSTINVHFHRKQKAFEKLVVSPLFNTGPMGDFIARYSYFTMAPQQVAFELMEPWYRVYQQFAAILNDPACQYRVALGAGDFVIYDNHRMVHARTGFKGARWMRGIYFDRVRNLVAAGL